MKLFLIILFSLLAIGLVVFAFYWSSTKTTVPTIAPQQTVKLYYYNLEKDKAISAGNISCEAAAVLPVERTVNSEDATIEKIINLLLQGNISEQEKAAGFITEFPNKEFKLLSANLADGVLSLEFSEVPGFTTGGSCRVGLLRTQIVKTAQQFSGVSEVRFFPDSLFQP